jgi:hypothetical protein
VKKERLNRYLDAVGFHQKINTMIENTGYDAFSFPELPDSKTKIIRRFYCRIFKKPSRDYNERLVSISLFIDDNSEARWSVLNYKAAEGKKRNVFRGLNSHNEMFASVSKVVKPNSFYVVV